MPLTYPPGDRVGFRITLGDDALVTLKGGPDYLDMLLSGMWGFDGDLLAARLDRAWLLYDSVTDSVLHRLKRFPRLRALCLTDTLVTDAGLAILGELPNLEELDLGGTLLTDRCLVHVSRLRALRKIHIRSPRISGSGVDQLRRSMRLAQVSLEPESEDPFTSSADQPAGAALVSLEYAQRLHQANEPGAALALVDQALTILNELVLTMGRKDLVGSLTDAHLSKGRALSRLGNQTAARESYVRANDVQLRHGEWDRFPNRASAWVLGTLDRAGAEERAGNYQTALGLYEDAVLLLDQMVHHQGRTDMTACLGRALLGKGNVLVQQGNYQASLPWCDRATAILQPLVQVQKRRGLELDLTRAIELKIKAMTGAHPGGSCEIK
jgi:hypothetical protein